jgi:hypothetical protein
MHCQIGSGILPVRIVLVTSRGPRLSTKGEGCLRLTPFGCSRARFLFIRTQYMSRAILFSVLLLEIPQVEQINRTSDVVFDPKMTRKFIALLPLPPHAEYGL